MEEKESFIVGHVVNAIKDTLNNKATMREFLAQKSLELGLQPGDTLTDEHKKKLTRDMTDLIMNNARTRQRMQDGNV
ncbi:hypothetical protein ACK8P5_26640 (plasmid) [Paenibacillus sp. EC2-1]|uniref:hypothetical protein n=1 Tax=Paenibacillus sp. EC2-1 TaxID=3388665 RepID=UPI003BEF1F2F